MKIGCVVMAAGNATRFGSNKLLQRIDHQTMIERTLSALPAELFEKIVVVTQYDEIAYIAKEYDFTVIRNNRPDLGQSRSLHLGLSALLDCDGILFSVADQPCLRRESIEALIELFSAHPDHIAALSHSGQRGNPCLFPSVYFPELFAIEGDRGGNVVIRRHEESLLLCETQTAAELLDMDTPRDFSRLP